MNLLKRAAAVFGLQVCLCMAALAHAGTAAPIKFGVFPNLSLRTLLTTYQPVVKAVAGASGRPVSLQSAPDFVRFHERTLAGEYDLLVTAPHFAWLAWKEAGYRPLLAYDQPVKGIIVVRKGSGIAALSDLKGRTVARADSIALVAMRMENALADAGLAAGRDYTLQQAGSHNNAALQVYQGKADAAILGVAALPKLSGEVKAGLEIIAETPPLPSQFYLIHQRVSPDMERKILLGIEEFMASGAGRAFLVQGGFGGLHRPSRTELDSVAPDARQVKRMLGGRPAAPRKTGTLP